MKCQYWDTLHQQTVSGFSILPLWKPGPGSRNQTLTLDSFGPPGLWTAGPPTCPCFSGIELPQADTKNFDQCSKKSQTKEIIAPNEGLITAPNGGTDLATISINSNSTPATNQELTQERGMGLQPSPMTSTLKQDNQVAKLRFLINERTPGPSAILLPLDSSTQFPWPWPSQCPDEPPMENIKFGGVTI
ncbi:hypothetical protein DSO57_1038288 [Entomophthora muscae]|uniref:Uncharacterized protein n=1 Tax=Entomophthora muscae TaxID=34485 RepID=A0ACC2U7S7_9FUNG|nr:hypothetical protein DSO57_1038288 [Entomophthora muscae]